MAAVNHRDSTVPAGLFASSRAVSAVRRAFAATAVVEGVALPLLVFAAVSQSAVRTPALIAALGIVHAVFWSLFLILAAVLWRVERWARYTATVAVIASLVPFGTWWFERRWLRHDR